MSKFNNNVTTLLKTLKNVNNRAIPADFTSKVINRIKACENKEQVVYDESNIDYFLNLLQVKEITPKDNFTSSVMTKIHKYEKLKSDNVKYTEDNIDSLLVSLKNQYVVEASDSFTYKVMNVIKDYEKHSEATAIEFSSIYKKFLVGSSIIAAASVLFALNIFSNYDPAVAEFMVTTFLNTGVF